MAKWEKGQSGNPAGRKPGTKNKLTVTREQILQVGGVNSDQFKALVTVMLTNPSFDLACEALRLVRLAHEVAPTTQPCLAMDITHKAPEGLQ